MKSKGKPRHIVALGFLYAVLMLLPAATAVQVGAQSTAAADTKDFSDFTELKIEDLLNKEVSVATKSRQRVSQAPGIVTVITAEEIRNMGARDLRDVLEMVPGFEFSKPRNAVLYIGIRGTKDPRTTSKLLLLIDGIPANTLMYGNSLNAGYEINMNAVERIEIIRGPGSALYGRNAFNGVVNVITKSADSNEVRATLSAGNQNTYRGGVEWNLKQKESGLHLNVEKFKTDGHQPLFDNGRGGKAPWPLYHDHLYIHAKANIKEFQITSFYTDMEFGNSQGPYITDSTFISKRGFHTARWNHAFNDRFSLNSILLFQHTKEVQQLEVFKPQLPGALGQLYPQGRYVTPEQNEYKYGINLEATYKVRENHIVLTGIQFEKYGITDCRIKANYDLYKTGAPALFYVDANGSKVYYGKNDMPEDPRGWIEGNGHSYSNFAVFIQDTFYPTPQLGLTIGGRYDKDNVFKGVFNPRCGIVWEFMKNTNLKLLYGQAYRAPNCQEQFKTTGFALGNPELKPEKIKTYELGLDVHLKKINITMNLFLNKLTDVIYVEPRAIGEPNRYWNKGKDTAKGIEIETRYAPSEQVWMFVNYSYVKSENSTPSSDNKTEITLSQKDISPHKVNMGLNIKMLKHLNFNTTLNYRSKREKFPNVLNEVGPYTLVNATLLADDIIKNISLSASLYNIFNEKYYDQEAGINEQPYQPGSSFVFSVSYTFK